MYQYDIQQNSTQEEVDETPYYRPPHMVYNGVAEVANVPVVSAPKKPKSNILLVALAGVIGLLTVGSVVYGEE